MKKLICGANLPVKSCGNVLIEDTFKVKTMLTAGLVSEAGASGSLMAEVLLASIW